ncbi:DUF1501 domain-containing protein [bacterium]|nr:DUF1501 domain-containing protein [bacterium]
MLSRRSLLQAGGTGLGSLAVSWLVSRDLQAGLAAPHHPAKARSVIWLFMEGGPSHLDLLDPKPLLNELSGKPLPSSFREPITAMGERGAPLLASPRTWAQHGESGLWASDWMPHIATQLDDIAVIRSCTTDGINHAGGVCQMNTCLNTAGRPSLGSWVHYGLGSANEDLPAFVVMCDSSGRPVNGPRNWGSGFMPAAHQGVRIDGIGEEPIRFLKPPKGFDAARQQESLALLADFNRAHAADRPQQSELEARIRSYELAFLLDETLVVWGGEFGRTPMSEKGNGRDHNPTGFSIWMAGGGVKGGQVIGATDELGLHAVEDRMHVRDIHASVLWLLGLDNMTLTYDHKGRPERPTINEGRFNRQLITG